MRHAKFANALMQIGATCVAFVFAGQAEAQWTVTYLSEVGTGAAAWAGDRNRQAGYTYVGQEHAAMWSALATSQVDLHPPIARSSRVYGMSRAEPWEQTQAVGQAIRSLEFAPHASLWTGTAASWVDLHPAGASRSVAEAAADGQQGGAAWFDGVAHAGLWSGNALSWIDLHPAGAIQSAIKALADGQQGGNTNDNLDAYRACVWSGTAASWTELHPTGAASSEVLAIGGGQQAGYFTLTRGGASHACVWANSPESIIDLSPPGSIISDARAINHGKVAGSVVYNFFSGYHACVWESISAGSSVDLHAYLSEGCTASQAYTISSDATTIYVAGTATMGGQRAVLWTRPICPGDFNRSGALEFQDILLFLGFWFDGDARTDFNGHGLSVHDIFDFINAWFAGC